MPTLRPCQPGLRARGQVTQSLVLQKFGAFGIDTTGGLTKGSGFTKLYGVDDASGGILTEWSTENDTTVDASCASSDSAAIAAISPQTQISC